MKKVDLNVDIGEGFPHDEALLEFATSANVCCGEHAGSWELTLQTIELCDRRGTRIGCHPGFPDRENMGRKIPSPEQISDYGESLHNQVFRFQTARKPAYIKPHGAWYNILCANGWSGEITPGIFGSAGGVLGAMAYETGIPVMLMPSSRSFGALEHVLGVRPIAEGFADRRYMPDGTLMPRSEPGAVLNDPEEIKAQVLELAPKVDSICLHGDTPDCLTFAKLVKKTLVDAGYEVGY